MQISAGGAGKYQKTLTDVDVEEELKELQAKEVKAESDGDYKSDIIKSDDRSRKID